MAGHLELRIDDLRSQFASEHQDNLDRFAGTDKRLRHVERRTAWLIGLVVGANGVPIWILAIYQLMKYLAPVVVLALCAPLSHAQYNPPAIPALVARDPAQATLRIKSHGGSGTVIATTAGRSWILSCAHMLEGSALHKTIVFDGPAQPWARAAKAPRAPRLLAWDYDADLSLIEIDNGPFFHVPVALDFHVPVALESRLQPVLWSVGYDEMRWPATKRRANVIGRGPGITYTREKPWHGRSGGCLAGDAGLVGVVQGYEVGFRDRGIYVSHDAILTFLRQYAVKFRAPGGSAESGERSAPYRPREWQPFALPMVPG